MTKRLTTLAICTLLLSMGHVCAESPCPCQTNQATSADSAESRQEPSPKSAPTEPITVCPCYPYAFFPGYCSWYAMQCGGSAVSINLPCDHGSGTCPNNNCESVPGKSKPSTATTEDETRLTERLPCCEGNAYTAGFTVEANHDFVLINWKDGQQIHARIDRVVVPAIKSAKIGGPTFPGGPLLNGHEVFLDVPPSPQCGKTPEKCPDVWPVIPMEDVTKVGPYQLQVALPEGKVFVVTYTELK